MTQARAVKAAAAQERYGPWTALAAAVILQALRDVQEGDRLSRQEALRWLLEDPWAETLCDGAFRDAGYIHALRREALKMAQAPGHQHRRFVGVRAR